MLFLSTKNYLQAEHACVENDRFLVFILLWSFMMQP